MIPSNQALLAGQAVPGDRARVEADPANKAIAGHQNGVEADPANKAVSSDHEAPDIGGHAETGADTPSQAGHRDGVSAGSRAPSGQQPGAEAWWKSAVVYQVYPRSFADSSGDGVGDLPGVTAKLDYLAQLGVDAIWLSPIYPSPQDDNGYDISDYQAIEPAFGTLDDFDLLISGAHARGLKIVMDLVVNHTSDEHPWFTESRSSKDNPKRDWYWWRSGREGMESGSPGAEPTNWESFFSGSVWQLDERTGEYYLHLFSRKQPDLNWENGEVRAAIYRMMRWWLDRGVDGFRMDVINMISKDTSLPDGRSTGLYGDGSPSYLFGPRLHEFIAEMHAEVFAGREAQLITVGETPGATIDDAIAFTDPSRSELDMVFQFEHVQLDQAETKWDHRPLNLLDLKASLGRWQAGLADVGWNSLYWNNHDQPRAVSRFGDDGLLRVESAKMLGTVLHMHKGTPYIYQGEELGMTNVPFAGPQDFLDIESVNYFAAATAWGLPPEQVMAALRIASRDNARSPMQWNSTPGGGFSTAQPWFPVNPNYVQINAEAAVADEDSVFHHYRKLIELRHQYPVVALGRFEMVLPNDPKVYAFTRTLGAESWLTLGNFTAEVVEVELAGWSSAELVLGNYPAGEPADLTLKPFEARIYRHISR